MTVRNMMIISIVIILIYSKNTILYCLDLMSRDSLFNYIIDRKTLISLINDSMNSFIRFLCILLWYVRDILHNVHSEIGMNAVISNRN